MSRITAALCGAMLVAACGRSAPAPENTNAEAHADGAVTLTAAQIAAASMGVARVGRAGAAGAIEAPACCQTSREAYRGSTIIG